MKAPSVAQRVGAVALATVLLALSATMAWAAVSDFEERAFVPTGVTVAGTDLSGMSESEARAAIEDAVAAPLMRPVEVTADGQQFRFDPADAVSVDVDAMLDEAFSARRRASFVRRLQHDVASQALTYEVKPLYSVDESAVVAWVGRVAKKVDRPAVNSKISVTSTQVVISESAEGRKTGRKKAAELIAAAFAEDKALTASDRQLKFPVKSVKPKVSEASFGKTITVDLSERRVRLFDGDKLEISYPCAVGTPDYPTPQGEWEVTLKRYLPTWINPGSDWGKDMPASIPPGPDNPLGTRAINISAPAIRFHGTNNIASVGTAASHGCMRMYRQDIEDFYERVEVGTKVYILP